MYKIILDFDDCIFDTERLKNIMADCDIAESERGAHVFDEIKKHPDYAEFDVRELVFPDALDFLQEYGDQVKILTTSTSITNANNQQDVSAAADYQELKMQLSGVLDVVAEFEVLPGEKQAVLEREKAKHEKIIFMDDRRNHVESGVLAGVFSFWLQRKAVVAKSPEQFTESIEGAKTITSFVELRRELEVLEST